MNRILALSALLVAFQAVSSPVYSAPFRSEVQARQTADKSLLQLMVLWPFVLKQPDLRYSTEKLINDGVLNKEVVENIFNFFSVPGTRIQITNERVLMGHPIPNFYWTGKIPFPPPEVGSDADLTNKRLMLLQKTSSLSDEEKYKHAYILIGYCNELNAALSRYKSCLKQVKSKEYGLIFANPEIQLQAIAKDPEDPSVYEKRVVLAQLHTRKDDLESARQKLLVCRQTLERLVGSKGIALLEKELTEKGEE